VSASAALATLVETGYAICSALELAALINSSSTELVAVQSSWSRLPRDQHLRDGGSYRSRRHSCFVWNQGAVTQVPHRAHWQPVDYNALHGGIERIFEPIEASVVATEIWQQLICDLSELFAKLQSTTQWFIEAHQFRIDTDSGIGRPTPEGAHRDGVDFVAIILIRRDHVKGGETRVFQAHGSKGTRFTLQEPWSMLLLDDDNVIHETTPLQPDGTGHQGIRDSLVLTFRRHGFQAPR
jgi:hypothetical protein